MNGTSGSYKYSSPPIMHREKITRCESIGKVTRDDQWVEIRRHRTLFFRRGETRRHNERSSTKT